MLEKEDAKYITELEKPTNVGDWTLIGLKETEEKTEEKGGDSWKQESFELFDKNETFSFFNFPSVVDQVPLYWIVILNPNI